MMELALAWAVGVLMGLCVLPVTERWRFRQFQRRQIREIES